MRKSAAIAAFIFSAFAIFNVCYAEGAYSPSGPIPRRSNMPLYLFYLSMTPDSAETLKQGQVGLGFDYSVSNVSIHQHPIVTKATERHRTALSYELEIDCEVHRYNFDVAYGVTDKFELRAEVPYLDIDGGYMDAFITTTEKFLNFKTPNNRQEVPRNRVSYWINHYSKNQLYMDTDSNGIGDIVLTAKYNLLDERARLPRISLRSCLKLPTASKRHYLGSGEFDCGAGVMLDKSYKRLAGCLNVNFEAINAPQVLESIDTEGYLISTVCALEFFLTKKFSMAGQLYMNTSPYPDTKDIPAFKDVLDVSLGLNYRLKDNLLIYVSCDENIRSSSPDFTARTGLRARI